jgi:hypothetical protein
LQRAKDLPVCVLDLLLEMRRTVVALSSAVLPGFQERGGNALLC